ncbi:MAG: RNA polymerase sigma factor [Pirellulales bacterium]
MKCRDVSPSDGASSATSLELLRAAQGCDAEAWRHLVSTYSRRMYRWCRLAGLQPADAANVVQEALAAVARKLADFRHDQPGATFRGWLRRIVENKITDHFRRQGRRVDVPVGGTDANSRMASVAWPENGALPADGSTAAGSSAAKQEAADTFATVRTEVGERDWKFFWRVAVDGQSAADVAREFGVSANAVRLVKMRVLRRLRNRMDGDALGDRLPNPAE